MFCQFLLYSKMNHLYIYTHIHVYIPFSHIVMLYHKWLDIVPRAIQMDIVAYPFQRQEFASINPKLPIHPTPSPTPWQPQVYSPSTWFSFLWKGSFVPYIRSRFVISYGICLSLSDLLHLAWESLVPPMLLQMALFYSFLRHMEILRARGQIGAVATSLHHSHSNAGSELHL